MKAGFLGRFQPLHRGHHRVIKEKKEELDLKIIIGSPEKSRTQENPLTAEERIDIISECHDVEILELKDTEKTPEGNMEWAGKLEALPIDAVVSGNDLVKELVRDYTGLELVEPEIRKDSIYSGTEIRRRIRSGEEWRYLVPECCHEKMEELKDKIEESGQEYEFEPGWKKENAYHGTAD